MVVLAKCILNTFIIKESLYPNPLFKIHLKISKFVWLETIRPRKVIRKITLETSVYRAENRDET